jgi:hypothetical protein
VHTQHHGTSGAAGRTTHLYLAAQALALALILSNSAAAGLIVSALGYDGHVRVGTTTGVEAHLTTTPFPPPNATIPLPATNPPLPAPLLPSKNLSMTFTTAIQQFPIPGGPLYSAAIIQISSPTGNVFANPLDNTLSFPAEADLFVYSDSPGMKVVVNPAIIGIEHFNLPPFASPLPGSYTVSGFGTQADPLHIHLGLTAGQVATQIGQNGFVKLHVRFSEMPVPEPSTGVLLLTALASLTQVLANRLRA